MLIVGVDCAELVPELVHIFCGKVDLLPKLVQYIEVRDQGG